MEVAALLNPLANLEQIQCTPSRADGVPRDLEDDLRAWGGAVIQRMGVYLLLPQRVSATAQVLFQRFWFITSMREFSVQDVCASSLFLATKIEEHPLSLRDLINVFDYVLQLDRWNARGAGGGWWSLRCSRSQPVLQSSDNDSANGQQFRWQPHSHGSSTYFKLRDAILVHEMHLLKRLGFQIEVQLPYSCLINYLNVLDLEKDRAVVQRCWSICTDMLQTPLPAMLPPHVLAVASIYYLCTINSSSSSIKLPMAPHPWYTLFDVSRCQLQVVCAWLRRLYDAHEGTASRVREEWGGCVDMGHKEAVRSWLARHSDKTSLDKAGEDPSRKARSSKVAEV